MPCSDSRESPAAIQSTVDGLRNRNDELAQLLCSMCRKAETSAFPHKDWPPKVYAWWQKHKAEDVARLNKLAQDHRERMKDLDDEELAVLSQVVFALQAERKQ